MKVFTEAGEAVDGALAFAVEDGLQSVANLLIDCFWATKITTQ